ncbi:AMP-binding protein [Actinophytocola gossypii]|uniref:AMP-binding protein n=1 Tax=Actinophytocola gossypii TaxID=2812003 RepID=A0ABT2J1I7_9PSEU|nr:AMP-binding protein [Actinophytocola gossypii]MCT2581673.1 AMP-binding protein [Actinophytocola gossypii]
MSADLVEVAATLDHPRDRLWAAVNDIESYPRFVREISWSQRSGGERTGAGTHYDVRFTVDQGPVARHDVEILVHRPPDHLVAVSRHWPRGHVAVRLTALAPERTELELTISLPRTRHPTAVTAGWLRKRARHAIALLDARLSGTVTDRLDQASTPQSQLAVAKILTRAGVLAAGRPDRLVRQLNALTRWGATVAGGYQAAFARTPHERAITDDLGELTFADVDTRTTRLANGLTDYGVRQGRRVALMCRNHGALVESLIACGKLGAHTLLLNTGLSAAQVTDVVHGHRPAALLLDEEFLPLTAGLPRGLPRISTWGGDEPSVDGLIEQAPADRVRPPTAPGKIIVLTSGTTSNPKGARRRNPHGLRTAAAVLSRIPLRAGERMLVAAPLFHTWGLAALQLGMPLHAQLVLARRFDAESTLRLIEEHRATSLFVVPIMLQRIMDLPPQVIRNYDTSSLRVVASSGSPLSGRLVTSVLDQFGDVLYNLYGSTEVSWASIADPADLRAAPTTAGRCPIGTRVGILDADGDPVPPGEVGRICVGNDMLFEGYTGGGTNPVYGDLMVTGDRGYLDADGRLFVSGRDDDMIISGGENVFPRPVEELLATLPQVADAAVVGVPDREFGQRFAAYVALRPGATLTEAAVREYVHDHLPRFAVPRDVVFVDSLPRNATGKVLRRLL